MGQGKIENIVKYSSGKMKLIEFEGEERTELIYDKGDEKKTRPTYTSASFK